MKNRVERYRMADRLDERIDAEILVARMFAEASDNQVVILQMLMLGMNHDEIAQKLGTTSQNVSCSVVRMRNRFGKYPFQ